MTPAWLTRYLSRGFRVVFYPTKTKGPTGTAAVGWTKRADSAEDYHEGDNVGVFTGHEVEPGKFLCDVDFDWTEGCPMARRLLPNTGFAFGRSTRKVSHAFYTTSAPLVSKEYSDISGMNFVELRGTKLDGEVGLQTMVPPSIHPSEEVVELKADEELTHDDDLSRHVLLYAIACCLLHHLGQRGLLHDTRLAVAGFLLGEGLEEDEVIAIGEAVAEASGNNVQDVAVAVRSTAARLRNGDRAYGKGALAKAIGENGKAVIARIKDWLGGGEFLIDEKDRILSNNLENIKRALTKLDVVLSFDTFAQCPLVYYPTYQNNGNGLKAYTGRLEDSIAYRIWFDIDKLFHFRPTKDLFFEYVLDLARQHEFNPVLDYLRTLTWDGVPRVDTWLIQSAKAADTEFHRTVSAILLIAAVRRITHPGCKFDEMVILESSVQGLQKSTALRLLCPKEEWFGDDLPLNVDSKQIVERTLGKWIIEASDLSGMRPASCEHLKGMLSRQVDGPVRMAYGRLAREQKRQFITVGTTNSFSYLSDITGNRRFWPMRLESPFDLAWIVANRDQLWAEAFAREQAGESIRLPERLYEIAGFQQERRRTTDAWEDRLSVEWEEEYQRLAADEIYEILGIPIERQNGITQRRVAEVMQLLGFRRMTVQNRKGKVLKGWARGRGKRDILSAPEEDES